MGKPENLSPSLLSRLFRSEKSRTSPVQQVHDSPPPSYSEATDESRQSSPVQPLQVENDDAYAHLAQFDTKFLIDDSGSMAGRRWNETRVAIESIVPICAKYDSDGIDIHFLNRKDKDEENVKDAKRVTRIFNSIQPGGGTPTGTRLHHILREYIKEYRARLGRSNDPYCMKPMSIIVITDGEAHDDPEAIIQQYASQLDHLKAPPGQVGIQFFQVGNDPEATRALRELDDGMEKYGVRDMVDTTTFDDRVDTSLGGFGQRRLGDANNGTDLRADTVLKVVLGSVIKRLDRCQTRKA